MAGRNLRLLRRQRITSRQAELDARTDADASPIRPKPLTPRAGVCRPSTPASHKYLIGRRLAAGTSGRTQPPALRSGRTRCWSPNPPAADHTRLPGLPARSHVGVVETVYHGAFSLPCCSTGPDGIGPAMPVYCVRSTRRPLARQRRAWLLHLRRLVRRLRAPGPGPGRRVRENR